MRFSRRPVKRKLTGRGKGSSARKACYSLYKILLELQKKKRFGVLSRPTRQGIRDHRQHV